MREEPCGVNTTQQTFPKEMCERTLQILLAGLWEDGVCIGPITASHIYLEMCIMKLEIKTEHWYMFLHICITTFHNQMLHFLDVSFLPVISLA